MIRPYDAIIIGSGFGGSAAAYRLSAAGARVLVLERGRRWTKDEYPRKPGDAWLFAPHKPASHNGWLDLRFFKGMTVVQGAGVGGGSLCYSSVVVEATPECFLRGWPPEISAAEMTPYYDRVRKMLSAKPIPPGQHTSRAELVERAARRLGYEHRLKSLPLAVTFDPDWNYDLQDPLDPRHSKPFVNDQGQPQGTCVHLGNCDIGCDVRAKNTLDLNYIPAAEKLGAEVRPLHVVQLIEPVAAGYRVIFDRIENGKLVRGHETAEKVVVAAGSLGSTELLLRCRDIYRTLRNVSGQLGSGWSANANVLTPDVYPADAGIRQGIGPTISAGLDFMDGADAGQRFMIEDDGFPNLLHNALSSLDFVSRWRPLAWMLRRHLRRSLGEPNPLGNVMMWLGAGVDAGDGQLKLARSLLCPWHRKLNLKWNVRASRPVIDAILAAHGRLSRSGGGKLRIPFYWKLFRSLLTVHPLGGCKMGSVPGDGVVDHRGEVFGHRKLYVADGAILPVPIGRNPSMTIAALGERIGEMICK